MPGVVFGGVPAVKMVRTAKAAAAACSMVALVAYREDGVDAGGGRTSLIVVALTWGVASLVRVGAVVWVADSLDVRVGGNVVMGAAGDEGVMKAWKAWAVVGVQMDRHRLW